MKEDIFSFLFQMAEFSDAEYQLGRFRRSAEEAPPERSGPLLSDDIRETLQQIRDDFLAMARELQMLLELSDDKRMPDDVHLPSELGVALSQLRVRDGHLEVTEELEGLLLSALLSLQIENGRVREEVRSIVQDVGSKSKKTLAEMLLNNQSE